MTNATMKFQHPSAICKTDPQVSVIVLNYNGIKYIDECLRSALDTDYPDFEVIFIDNNSADNSWEYVKKKYGNNSKIRFFKNASNLGYAEGNNVGAKHAKGKYLAFLNVDTKVDSSWLGELVKVMEDDPYVGIAQPKLLSMNDRNTFDSCGSYITPYGFLHHLGSLQKDIGQLNRRLEILAVKGAAFMIRRVLLEEIGLFDSDYFCYYEELDLCWRSWLRGLRVTFIPSSVVYHAVGGTTREVGFKDKLFFFHGHKNYVRTLIKNLSIPFLIKLIIPYILFFSSFALISTFRQARLAMFYTIKAWIWNLRNFRETWGKRVFVQKRVRKLFDSAFLQKLMVKRSLSIGYYLSFAPRKLKSLWHIP